MFDLRNGKKKKTCFCCLSPLSLSFLPVVFNCHRRRVSEVMQATTTVTTIATTTAHQIDFNFQPGFSSSPILSGSIISACSVFASFSCFLSFSLASAVRKLESLSLSAEKEEKSLHFFCLLLLSFGEGRFDIFFSATRSPVQSDEQFETCHCSGGDPVFPLKTEVILVCSIEFFATFCRKTFSSSLPPDRLYLPAAAGANWRQPFEWRRL